MFCKMCGTEAGANDHYCVKCGTQFVTGPETPYDSHVNISAQPQPDRPSEFKIAAKRNTQLALLTILIVIFGLVIFNTNFDEANLNLTEGVSETEFNSEKRPGPVPAKYEIISEEDISYANIKRKSYRIVVSPEITEEQVEPTVNEIIHKLTTADGDVDEISISLYSDPKIVDGVYDVALAAWAVNGRWGDISYDAARSNDRSKHATSITIKPDLEEYLKQRSVQEEKFGLTEEERKHIFREVAAAEDRGMTEAERMYPDPENIMEQVYKIGELQDKYKAEILKKWGISEEVWNEIMVEGVTMHWPKN